MHPSPAQLQATYHDLFGATVRGDRDGVVVALGEDKASFLSPSAFQSRYPGLPLPSDLSKGWFAGGVFSVGSLQRVEGVLSGAGVNSMRTPSGSIVVPPAEAAGALLEFSAVA